MVGVATVVIVGDGEQELPPRGEEGSEEGEAGVDAVVVAVAAFGVVTALEEEVVAGTEDLACMDALIIGGDPLAFVFVLHAADDDGDGGDDSRNFVMGE